MIAIPLVGFTTGEPEAFDAPCCGQQITFTELFRSRSNKRDTVLASIIVSWDVCPCMREAQSLASWAEEREQVRKWQAEQDDYHREMRGQLGARIDQWFPLWRESPRAQRQTFVNYQVSSPNQAAAKDRVMAWGEGFTETTERGLYLMGPVGTGKSHLASALCHSLRARSVGCGMVKVPRLLARLRETYDQPGSGDEASIEKDLLAVPILILDDLGVERPTEWALEKLFLLVDARYELCRPIILTTNWKPKDLEANLGSRLVSRLVEMCELVPLTGSDQRIRRARGIAEAADLRDGAR